MVRAAISKMELTFTETERKIASYFLEHGAEAVSMSSTEVAKAIGVSQSSIIKFVKKIGFDGFVDFKMNLYESDERSRKAVSDAFGVRGISLEDPFDRVVEGLFSSEVEALRQTFENLDMEKLAQAVEMIDDAQRVFICGKGTSYLVGLDLAHKLMKFGMTVICDSDLDTMLIGATGARSGDLYIAFSYSGESKDLVRILAAARKCGARTLVATKNVRSSLVGLADVCLEIVTEEQTFRAATMSSRIAFGALADALFLGVFKMDLPERQRRLTLYEADVFEGA